MAGTLFGAPLGRPGPGLAGPLFIFDMAYVTAGRVTSYRPSWWAWALAYRPFVSLHRKRPAGDAYARRAMCQIAHISYCITGPLGLLSSSSIGQWCPPGMETTMASKFTIFWVSESAQSSINLGSFDTREEAEAHIEGAWGEMRAQGNAQDLSWINAGALEIDEDSE